MRKLSFDKWKNSMSFMIDDNFDNNFLQTITPLTRLINESCRNFSNPRELSTFLITDSGNISSLLKLKAFVSVIGLSEERLKRVVSLIRFKNFGHEFRTEWDVNRISRTLISNQEFKDLLIEFFINGRNSRIGREMPLYYMRNFNLLNEEFIADLAEFNYVDRILNDNEIQGKYSNEVGAHVEKIIQNKLDEYKNSTDENLRYEIQKEFPLLNKNIDFLIPSVDSPVILIESSYNITTGSGQSKRADQLVELYGILMRHNANHRANRISMLNYCDGFGWVGRQSDLHRIYDASDFVFNQNHLHVLDEVLNEYY
jgi:DpnII restriction endonuclease